MDVFELCTNWALQITWSSPFVTVAHLLVLQRTPQAHAWCVWQAVRLRCLLNSLSCSVLHLYIRTTIILYEADLSIIIPHKVLKREEAPAVRSHWDFTWQGQGFGWRLQQGHFVPNGAECRALLQNAGDRKQLDGWLTADKEKKTWKLS